MPFLMLRNDKFLAAMLAMALVAMSSFPVAEAQQEQAGKIHVDVNLVLVEATVKNKAGQVIDGLGMKDFEVGEDGVAQTVTHFSRDQLPLAVALVVDLSSSIEPFLRPLRYATQTALRTLKQEDQVSLFTFTSQAERKVNLTHDKRAVSDQIEFFSAGGSTNINGAIYEAAQYLREDAPASARRVIILVSDNVPTDAGGFSPQEVEDAVLEADSAVYGLKIPGQNPFGARMAAKMGGKVNVSKLTADTGGEIFDVEKEGSLYIAFQALIQRLKTRYTLGYTPANPARGGSFHKLEVRLTANHGELGKDYTIASKRGYYSNRAPSPALH
ncbi:MAG: VWA domain-containing protein [Candidatus Acidiferrales bacterium]